MDALWDEPGRLALCLAHSLSTLGIVAVLLPPSAFYLLPRPEDKARPHVPPALGA